MATLGQKLSIYRNQYHLSQKDMAKRLGIATSTLGMYETDKREPNIKMLKKFAHVFHTSIDYLVDDASDPQSISLDDPNANYTYKDRYVPKKYLDIVRELMDKDNN